MRHPGTCLGHASFHGLMRCFALHAFPTRPGRWLGKGIRSASTEGYNLFSSNPKATTWTEPSTPSSSSEMDGSGVGRADSGDSSEQGDTQRGRRFRFTPFALSAFDGGESASLDYSFREGKNGLLFSGMRDEVSDAVEVLTLPDISVRLCRIKMSRMEVMVNAHGKKAHFVGRSHFGGSRPRFHEASWC